MKKTIIDTNNIASSKNVHYMDIWYANLPDTNSHVKRGTRPVVIVSNDEANTYSHVITIVPVTSNLHQKTQPTHVFLSGNGLKCGSIACCEQVMALDKACLSNRVGEVSDWYKRLAIQYALATQLNIDLQVNLAA